MTPLKNGNKSIVLLLRKPFFKEKRKHPYTNKVERHAGMMRLCCRGRISLVEMLKPIASSPRNISCKVKENDQIRAVVAEDEMETLVSSEVPGTEKSTSN